MVRRGDQEAARRPPSIPGLNRRSGRIPALPYSGSEGEMLRKGFSTVVAPARCGNPAVVRGRRVCQPAEGSLPLRIAGPDIRCPRVELRAAGALTLRQSVNEVFRSRSSSFAVQYGKLDSAGTPWLRIALPDTRCPRIELRAAGCALLPKRILRCRLEERRLSYKAFEEAEPPAPSQSFGEE